jgi:hypothetical protein
VVDGTMGILSRKMAMPEIHQANPIHQNTLKQKFDAKQLKKSILKNPIDLTKPLRGERSYAYNSMKDKSALTVV